MTTRKLKPAGTVTITIERGEPQELHSAILSGEVSRAVVLKRSTQTGEWCVRHKNVTTGQEFSGGYFPANDATGGEVGAFRRAFREYMRRCKALGVEPFPQLCPVCNNPLYDIGGYLGCLWSFH